MMPEKSMRIHGTRRRRRSARSVRAPTAGAFLKHAEWFRFSRARLMLMIFAAIHDLIRAAYLLRRCTYRAIGGISAAQYQFSCGQRDPARRLRQRKWQKVSTAYWPLVTTSQRCVLANTAIYILLPLQNLFFPQQRRKSGCHGSSFTTIRAYRLLPYDAYHADPLLPLF